MLFELFRMPSLNHSLSLDAMSEEQALEKNKEEYEALNENISRLNADSPTKQIIKFLTRGLRYIRVIGRGSMPYEGV